MSLIFNQERLKLWLSKQDTQRNLVLTWHVWHRVSGSVSVFETGFETHIAISAFSLGQGYNDSN